MRLPVFKQFMLIGLLLGLLLPVAATAQDSSASTLAESPRSILFVGNSLTMYNNAVYTHLRQLLIADDPIALEHIFTKTMMISGGLLADHRDGLMQMLRSRDWDIVVLQGHSREAVDEGMTESFVNTAGEYAGAVRAQGGEPVLFMTWAYADKPEMTRDLAQAYALLGNELTAQVVPVGLAFSLAISEIPRVSLYATDNIHPTLEGTYLAAAVFYAALFGKSPVDLDYDAGLDSKLASQLRIVAWQTVQEYVDQ